MTAPTGGRRTEGSGEDDAPSTARRPVFVVGTGRSGSSFLADVLARHPDVAFLTGLSDRYPRRHRYNRMAMRGLDVPGIRRLVGRRCGIEEAYDFWDAHAPGFSEPTRDLVAADVTPRTKASLRRAVAANLVPGRRRFLAKITGWGRIGYLDEVFPDARFVHLVRDGRDVANSLLQVDFWQGWRGPQNWRFGELPPDLRELWERHDRSFVALAGICWRLLVDSVEDARRELPPERFLEIRYEDFVRSPRDLLEEVLEACDLEPSPRFFDDFDREEVRDASGKHRRDLTPHQQENLAAVTREPRQRYGYG